jgi:hypothetical protein
VPRTTAELVQGVIEVDSTAVASLTPFITIANRLVTSKCTSELLTEDDLTDIETWLAAHFYAVRDMRNASEQVGPLMESKQYKLDLYLASTMYGQAAIAADTSGALAQYNQQLIKGRGTRASLTWLGTSCEDE